jgi:hypothetical protein
VCQVFDTGPGMGHDGLEAYFRMALDRKERGLVPIVEESGDRRILSGQLSKFGERGRDCWAHGDEQLLCS